MYPILLFTLLPLLPSSSASALPPRQLTLTAPFTLRAYNPNSPIHLAHLNANAGHFWLGKPPSPACPPPSTHCPNATQTTLLVSIDGYAVLNAAVPDGQYVYVAKDGALSFTKPGNADDVAAMAFPRGFGYDVDNGTALFTFDGTLSKGWLACEGAVGAVRGEEGVVEGAVMGDEGAVKGNGQRKGERGPWRVVADVKGMDGDADGEGCVGFEARGVEGKGVGAGVVWEYD